MQYDPRTAVMPDVIAAFYRALAPYAEDHPQAQIVILPREIPYFVSIRIIDPDFEGIFSGDRIDFLWELINETASELYQHISAIIPWTPEEFDYHIIKTARFDEDDDGRGTFIAGSTVFREDLDGHIVYLTVNSPDAENSHHDAGYVAYQMVDRVPRVVFIEDIDLSIDMGDAVRNDDGHVPVFNTIEEARQAGFEAAGRKLSRLIPA